MRGMILIDIFNSDVGESIEESVSIVGRWVVVSECPLVGGSGFSRGDSFVFGEAFEFREGYFKFGHKV